MAIEIVSFPTKHGNFPGRKLLNKIPEGTNGGSKNNYTRCMIFSNDVGVVHGLGDVGVRLGEPICFHQGEVYQATGRPDNSLRRNGALIFWLVVWNMFYFSI